MVVWVTDRSGIAASTTHANGVKESRSINAIPATDTVLPYSPTIAEIQADFRVAAQMALNKSDITMMRCVEAGIAAPTAWNTYRKTLRAIANGTDSISVALPTQPPFPAGT